MGESPSQASTPAGAVFLSYASEDVSAAERIATALRSAGIEVWFDKSELRGGDVWDRKINEQIHRCRLFMPIVSAATEARVEGYFRREWKLAVDRTHDLSERVAFLVPVVIDSTPELKADVPDAFRRVQWTRLPGGETSPTFVDRVQRLLSPESSRVRAAEAPAGSTTAPTPERSVRPAWRSRSALWTVSAVLGVALAYFVVDWFWLSKRSASLMSAANTSASVGSQPVAASVNTVAVLPFVDMSEKHDQEYLSDGLAEELISRLARAADLKVIARTSSFQFKGKSEDAREIAGKLGVANLVEGSLRRSGTRIRVNVHLIRAADATPLWSQSYDREDADALKMQDEIADAVAKSLSVSLKLDSANTPKLTEAYVRVLRARELVEHDWSKSGWDRAIALIEEALRQDPQLGLAWAELSRARLVWLTGTADALRTAVIEPAERALAISPNLSESHVAMARVLMFIYWDWTRAEQETQKALELGPNSAEVHRNAFYLTTMLGRWDEALGHAKRANELDPLSPLNLLMLGNAQANVFAFSDAERSYRSALESGEMALVHSALASVLWDQGKRAEAVAENDREPDESRLRNQAFFYQKLGRKQEARRALDSFIEKYGDTDPAAIGDLFGSLGRLDEAFQWYDRAIRDRSTLMAYLLQRTRDPDLRQMCKDPRFKALLRRMNLPE